MVSRDVWLAAGRAGLLGIDMDQKYGGGGNPDYRFYLILDEEFARAGATGPGSRCTTTSIGQYLLRLCTPEQRERWLPGYCSGEIITAIAMSEPGAGSDLQGIRTTAVRDGDTTCSTARRPSSPTGSWPTWSSWWPGPIRPPGTGGSACSWWSAAWTASPGAGTWTRSACTRRTPRSCSSPTSGCPPANMLGEEGGGFVALMQNLPRERVYDRRHRAGAAEQVFAGHARPTASSGRRSARPIGAFQHNRFVLAEMATELAVARAFTDRAMMEHCADRLSTPMGVHGQVVGHRAV